MGLRKRGANKQAIFLGLSTSKIFSQNNNKEFTLLVK
jgi:hypothetical protein